MQLIGEALKLTEGLSFDRASVCSGQACSHRRAPYRRPASYRCSADCCPRASRPCPAHRRTVSYRAFADCRQGRSDPYPADPRTGVFRTACRQPVGSAQISLHRRALIGNRNLAGCRASGRWGKPADEFGSLPWPLGFCGEGWLPANGLPESFLPCDWSRLDGPPDLSGCGAGGSSYFRCSAAADWLVLR